MVATSADITDQIRIVESASTENFVELTHLAKLDPEISFSNANLGKADFSNCDLSGFDFRGSDLDGAVFTNAKIENCRIDIGWFATDSLFDAADFILALMTTVRQTLNQGDQDEVKLVLYHLETRANEGGVVAHEAILQLRSNGIFPLGAERFQDGRLYRETAVDPTLPDSEKDLPKRPDANSKDQKSFSDTDGKIQGYELDNADAMFSYGFNKQNGLGGTPRDPFSANEWYHKAAELDEVRAMLQLGYNLAKGIGVDAPDPVAANEWFRKAADLGDAVAMVNLGFNLEYGIGVDTPDPVAANEWFRKAADLGYARAMCNLGVNLEKGLGVDTPDPVAANEWFRKAADLGDAVAMVNLGFNLENGIGVDTPDPVAANEWFRKAADLRDTGAGGEGLDLSALYDWHRGIAAD